MAYSYAWALYDVLLVRNDSPSPTPVAEALAPATCLSVAKHTWFH